MDRPAPQRRLNQLWTLFLLAALALPACDGPEPLVLARNGGPGENGADANGFVPFVFIQAGDPQIGGWTSIDDTKARFIQLAHLANDIRPAVVVVVGDLVNDGHRAKEAGAQHEKELAAFDEGLAEFRVPVRLLIGNHDDPATYRRKYGPDHYSFTVNNCEFICLNSNLMTRLALSAERRSAVNEQWRWLETTLERARKENRAHVFVALHHPPLTVLPGSAKRLDSLFRKYGVNVVLAGHIHETRQYTLRGYTTFTVAGTGWAADKKGFGYRLFKVYADRVEEDYVRLDAPLPATIPAGAK